MFGCGYVLLDIWWIYLVGLLDMLVLHGLYSLKVGASQNTCLCLVTDNFLSRVLHEVNNRVETYLYLSRIYREVCDQVQI